MNFTIDIPEGLSFEAKPQKILVYLRASGRRKNKNQKWFAKNYSRRPNWLLWSKNAKMYVTSPGAEQVHDSFKVTLSYNDPEGNNNW